MNPADARLTPRLAVMLTFLEFTPPAPFFDTIPATLHQQRIEA